MESITIDGVTYRIGDIVRIKYDFNEHEKGNLFRIVGFRTSIITGKDMYDLIRLKTNTKHCGLYVDRFELVKNNNKDMY